MHKCWMNSVHLPPASTSNSSSTPTWGLSRIRAKQYCVGPRDYAILLSALVKDPSRRATVILYPGNE